MAGPIFVARRCGGDVLRPDGRGHPFGHHVRRSAAGGLLRETLTGQRTGISAAQAYTRYFRLRRPYFRLMTWLQWWVGRWPDPALFAYARLAQPWPIFPLLMGEYLRASRPASAL